MYTRARHRHGLCVPAQLFFALIALFSCLPCYAQPAVIDAGLQVEPASEETTTEGTWVAPRRQLHLDGRLGDRRWQGPELASSVLRAHRHKPATAHRTIASDAAIVSTERPYSFKTYPPGSLTWRTAGDGCRKSDYAFLDTRAPVPAEVPMLLLIGQQKSGTTWLFDLLKQHPAVVIARSPNSGKRLKEVHYLDGGITGIKWREHDGPAYARAFTDHASSETVAALAAGEATALDGSPVICSHEAAPRAAAVMPQARLVVILRDPVARLLSSYRMQLRMKCYSPAAGRRIPGVTCSMPPIDKWLEARLDAAEKYPNSLYPTTVPPGEEQNFQESWCDMKESGSYANYHNEYSDAVYDQIVMCSARTAQQLAWWLAFFPPDRFLIYTSQQLHDPVQAKEIGQEVLRHAGITDPEPFTTAQVEKARGFPSKKHAEPDISHLVARLRARFEKPMIELTALINEHWPELNFTGIPHEV